MIKTHYKLHVNEDQKQILIDLKNVVDDLYSQTQNYLNSSDFDKYKTKTITSNIIGGLKYNHSYNTLSKKDRDFLFKISMDMLDPNGSYLNDKLIKINIYNYSIYPDYDVPVEDLFLIRKSNKNKAYYFKLDFIKPTAFRIIDDGFFSIEPASAYLNLNQIDNPEIVLESFGKIDINDPNHIQIIDLKYPYVAYLSHGIEAKFLIPKNQKSSYFESKPNYKKTIITDTFSRNAYNKVYRTQYRKYNGLGNENFQENPDEYLQKDIDGLEDSLTTFNSAFSEELMQDSRIFVIDKDYNHHWDGFVKKLTEKLHYSKRHCLVFLEKTFTPLEECPYCKSTDVKDSKFSTHRIVHCNHCNSMIDRDPNFTLNALTEVRDSFQGDLQEHLGKTVVLKKEIY